MKFCSTSAAWQANNNGHSDIRFGRRSAIHLQLTKMVLPSRTMSKRFAWKCPKCSNKVELMVSVSTPPVCANKKSHTGKPQTMELLSGGPGAILEKKPTKKGS